MGQQLVSPQGRVCHSLTALPDGPRLPADLNTFNLLLDSHTKV